MSIRQSFKSLTNADLWLLGIGVGLIAIHLTLVSKSGQEELFSTSMLFWVATATMIWQKRDRLLVQGSLFGTLVGTLLLIGVLLRSQAIIGIDIFLRLYPFLSIVALGLIASGLRDLRQYWQELVILSFLIPHPGILSYMFDLSEITARFSATLLWYLGFDASWRGVFIVLPRGFVGVNPGCSGYGSIMQLLGISIIFLFMFPVPRLQKLFMPIIAVLIGFVMNSIRVAIMAVLRVSSNPEGFEYWHNEEGSLLFSLISVSLFGLVCFWVTQQEQLAED